MNSTNNGSRISTRIIIIGSTILLLILAALSLIVSVSDTEIWSANLFLNFGTEMLGAVVTFIIIGVIVGGREAQQRHAEQAEMISELLKKEVRKASEERPDLNISEGELSIVDRRLNRVASLFEGLRILWVDDVPSNNVNESEILRQLGVRLDLALSSSEAARKLDSAKYDFVISDMGRENSYTEGMDFFLLREAQGKTLPPTIFYVDNVRYTEHTAKAFGSTNRPDELFHLIMDIVERIRA